jgi:hypothetical protein
MTEDQQMIDTEKKEEKKLVLISMGPEDMWNDYLEKINNLMLEEKKFRQTNDGLGGAKKCCEVLQVAFDEKDYARMREWMLQLCRRRGQGKKAITDMTALMMTFLEKLPSREEKFTMLECLREACEGKMYTEREYSECTVQYV